MKQVTKCGTALGATFAVGRVILVVIGRLIAEQ
jgi:hypothetical protein